MSEHDPEDLEALRLNLEQVARAADTWRSRAVAAGGFLGAAAAVSLWGVSQEAARFSGFVVWVAGAAALFYVAAVVGFLVASVLPAPNFEANAAATIADQMYAFARVETKPIKGLVLISATLGSLAIAATTLGSFLVLFWPTQSYEVVSVSDEEQRAAVGRLCPGIPDPFHAAVTDDGSELLRIRVLGDSCGEGQTKLIVPRASIERLELSES